MQVTNQAKLMFADDGYTKGQVVAYYEAVAPVMLRHLANRPLTLERYPNGIGEKGFMQKNASRHFPASIGRAEMPKKGGVTIHPVVRDEAGVAYLANQGTISFHITTTRVGSTCPDRIVIDLDPPGGEYIAARAATWAVRDLLDELGLAGFPMATGSKGYHVIVPITPSIPLAGVADTARSIAELLTARRPDLLTTEFKIERRGRKVFVDWLRNRYSATSIAPWSLRPRRGAPVAMPIAWDELDETDPNTWTMVTALDRLGGPMWDGFEAAAVDLHAATEAASAAVQEAGITIEPFDRFRS